MNELQIFSYNGNEVRTIQKDGEPWWVLKDVCNVLDLSDTNKTAERLDVDELTRIKFVTGGQNREMLCINESGLYNVILRSDKPEAKPFRKWVTSGINGWSNPSAVIGRIVFIRVYTVNREIFFIAVI